MARFPATRRTCAGFSLLEVLVAVVVLATGLIALAALQGQLARASADAKVRGRVAAMLTARLDELRSGGYGSLADGTTGAMTSTTGDCDPATPDATDWIDCTRIQANLGSLTATQAIATWYGTTGFTTPPPASPDPRVAQFKRVTLTASWTDAAGEPHQATEESDISALALTNFLVPPPQDLATSVGNGPVVRTTDPGTAGVIPIALGSTADSATTNPTPELVGRDKNQKIVGTKFTVLNYTPPGSDGVIIRKRFENEIVKCSCQYGAGGTNLPEIYRTAQWPAVWTGERYDLYQAASVAVAPGQSRNAGPRPGVEQSPLCQECCRDHHDDRNAQGARFDPERTDGSTQKFDFNGTSLVAASSAPDGTYVDACRVIRVDGFWRTAADMYARQFGLLETQTVAGAKAKTGLPTANAVSAYTGFAKNYLRQFDGSSSNAPANGQAMFDGTSGINVPDVVDIATASNSDYRYLHARGLYVDYLEQKAREKLQQVLADHDPQGACPDGTNIEDCVMPYLPFTTANLTEIATWAASDTSILAVNSGNLLATCADGSSPCPQFPSGSRTLGKATGSADNTATMRLSNSGIAVSEVLPATLGGVDPTDDSDKLGDGQHFTVGASSAGPTFDVRVSGGGSNPFVFFTLGSDVDRECLKPAGADHHCVTAAGTVLPQAGTIRVANYWIETTSTHPVTANCGGQTATDTIAVPLFRNYVVTAASISGVAGTIGVATNDGKISETTATTFAAIPANALVLVTLAEQAGSPTEATIASCTTNGGHNKIQNIVWTKPWTQP